MIFSHEANANNFFKAIVANNMIKNFLIYTSTKTNTKSQRIRIGFPKKKLFWRRNGRKSYQRKRIRKTTTFTRIKNTNDDAESLKLDWNGIANATEKPKRRFSNLRMIRSVFIYQLTDTRSLRLAIYSYCRLIIEEYANTYARNESSRWNV